MKVDGSEEENTGGRSGWMRRGKENREWVEWELGDEESEWVVVSSVARGKG
jgi:hypothetical protein